MESLLVKVSTPTRIDLAGGTLDIYPIYLFEGSGLTLNVAIDLMSNVELEKRSDKGIRIEAEDLDLVLEASCLDELKSGESFARLDLVVRILKFYKPTCGLTIRIRSQIPAGSGLGGSSSLLVGLSTALIQLEDLPVSQRQVIDWGGDIETQSIRVPTGRQDYFPAMYGGFNALWFELQGIRQEKLKLPNQLKDQLQHQLLLGYSGASRFSGAINWDIVRRYIDGDSDTVTKMEKIRRTAGAMYESLKCGDLDQFSQHLAEEWNNRKGLAEGVSTPAVERIFEANNQVGALANKLCGAGGGGCFVTLAKDGCEAAVREAILDNGGQVLPYSFAEHGVQVTQ